MAFPVSVNAHLPDEKPLWAPALQGFRIVSFPWKLAWLLNDAD